MISVECKRIVYVEQKDKSGAIPTNGKRAAIWCTEHCLFWVGLQQNVQPKVRALWAPADLDSFGQLQWCVEQVQKWMGEP